MWSARKSKVIDDPVDINSMLHDFAGSNHEFYDTMCTTNVEEARNDSAKEFMRRLLKMVFLFIPVAQNI